MQHALHRPHGLHRAHRHRRGERILFAWYFNDVNLLLSSYITGDSRIMIRRNIQERLRTIAPFLRLDHDPYLVINDGRLFWTGCA
jgi:uncharacterized membrane protein (UPF0182 family)